MIIGNFKYDQNTDTYTGGIMTLTVHRSGVQLRPVKKVGEKGPEYRMYADTETGSVELGSAWKRTGSKGDFLSIILDDPALEHGLNAALFFKEDDKAELVWTRQAKKKKAE